MSTRPIIIVGTGRCGSTLLSHIIKQHDELLSISEVFSFVTDLGIRIERAFPVGTVTGAEFWDILATPQPRQSTLLANGLQMAEVVYRWDDGRFGPNELPPILQGMLPHLDGLNPDMLFDVLAHDVPQWGPADISTHYDCLFRTLAAQLGKRQWVERSGGSLRVVERLAAAFPDAKFVHLVRDGRDTALSMSRHIGFRMAILCGLQTEQLGADPYETDDRTDEADLSDELAATLPEHFTREAFEQFDLPPSLCGHYWSGEIIAGLRALKRMPEDSLLTLRYEDLLSDPMTAVKQVGQFVECEVSERWIERSAGLVHNVPPRWTTLPQAQQEDLSQACRPGFEALEQVGLTWSNQ